MKNLLPNFLYEKIINKYLYDFITEIRIRKNKPIVVCYKGKYEVLKEIKNFKTETIIATEDLIDYIVAVATKQSFYAYSDQIKKGYITTDNGIRIGLCGTIVLNDNNILTIKDFSSLNIRIPHNVQGCSKNLIDLIVSKSSIKNTLIISPPGAGKTTIVRDLAEKLSNEKHIDNILIVDERYELCGIGNNVNIFNAEFADIISGGIKKFAFIECLKTMNSKVVVADEINEKEDIDAIIKLARSGVNIMATAHASNLFDLKNNEIYRDMINQKIFQRIIVLSKTNKIGQIEGVFDENLNLIYFPIQI